MGATKIEWTATRHPDGTYSPGYSFNPWVGCTKVGPPCDNCYAEGWAKRSGHPELWQGERRRTTAENWNQPVKWNATAERLGVRHRVFCASLADVFDNQVPTEWRTDLWRLIAATPHLDWLLLTKRPQNIAKMYPGNIDVANEIRRFAGIQDWPWPNVWLGMTSGDQREFDRDWPHLSSIAAAVRFISYEPALGPLEMPMGKPRPDWIICGGESGGHARLMDPEWARSLRDDCASLSIPFFFKQMTKKAPIPADLLVRQFPRS